MNQEVSMNSADLARVRGKISNRISELDGKRIMVVGDIGLDEYVMGEVKRISPEAPVPVVEVKSQDSRLGLAANVAQNVVSLGGAVDLISVVGADSAATELKTQLARQGVATDHLLVDKSRPTTRKMRIMAEHHHIVRVDFELKQFLDPAVEKSLLARIKESLPQCAGVIIQDYAKGLLSEAGIKEVIRLGQVAGKRVMVDPHRTTPLRFYAGADLMTPNRDEAIALSDINADDLHGSSNVILEIGQTLREKAKISHLVVTRGKEGMTLFDQGRIVHLPTYARQVFDVTGAGDTVIAALALAWSSGWALEEACVLANFAAGVVVGKVGCVPCTRAELLSYMDSF